MKVAKWGGIGILAFVYACGGGSSVTGNAGTTGIGASPSLNITVAGGGTVTSPDGSINCSATCSQSSTVGAAVHLDAAPASGMQFMGWSGACSGTGGCDLTISGDTVVGAAFAAVATVLFHVTPVGAGSGVVTSSPEGLSCPDICGMDVAPGTVVTLIATANVGSQFEGYGGTTCSGTTCSARVTSAATVFANFSAVTAAPALHTLTVTDAGGGTVVSNPGGISCPGACSAPFQEGATVALTALASSGFTFTGWTGACTGSGGCSIALGSDAAVTATFTAVDPCAGLVPALPAPKTFTAAVAGPMNQCNAATTDGDGNLYVEQFFNLDGSNHMTTSGTAARPSTTS
jgi:uncharacterized repeat protein (TIGR02543 family)